MQIDFGAGLESVSDVLELQGEETLAEAYREAWAFSARQTESFGYPPALFRCLDDSEWGMLSMFGFLELADGTISPSSDVRVQAALGGSTPVEHISSETDLVPAARRLLKRIFDGVPGLRAWTEMSLSLKGLDLSGLV